jgi:hypothetical protein
MGQAEGGIYNDKDYKKLLYQPGKQSDHTRGGHNKEILFKSWDKIIYLSLLVFE